MNFLFCALIWKPLLAQRGRTILGIVAIALGVALGLGIHLMNRATLDAVTRATNALFGSADLVIAGTAQGFDEALYPQIARVDGVAAISPVLEVRAQVIARREALSVLGIDWLRISAFNELAAPVKRSRDDLSAFASDALVLTTPAADSLGLHPGSTVDLQIGMQPVRFKVTAIVPAEISAGFVDIAAAQWQFGELGRLTRLEVRVSNRSNLDAVAAAIRQLLPEGLSVDPPTVLAQQSAQLSRAFRINLTALALVALFTGAFLIYTTQSLAVLRRRKEFALLHALGVTRPQQVRAVIGSGLIVGTVGSFLGVLLGIFMAKVALPYFVTVLGVDRATPRVLITPYELSAFFILGLIAALAGAVAPAWFAANIPTARALKAGNMDFGKSPSRAHWSLSLWLLAIGLLFAPPIFELPLLGYVAIALILVGAVLFTPTLTHRALDSIPRLAGATLLTGIAQLRASARSATQSIAAVLVSVSLMVAMAIMVSSLRGSFADSLERLLPGDLVVQSSSGFGASTAFLDRDSVTRLTAIPGIARVAALRSVPVSLERATLPATLSARPIDTDDASRSLTLRSHAERPAPAHSTPVWISVALADRYHLNVDDQIRFRLHDREAIGSIRGVTTDYINQPAGVIAMNYDSYYELTGDKRITSALVWLRDPRSIDTVAAAIRDSTRGGAVPEISRPQDIKDRSLSIFDNVFAITYALLAVAIVIGMFGISANASTQVLARRSEFGLLRHLGFTRRQIAAMLTCEGLSLGAFGTLCGLLVGGVVSAVLIHVVGRQSFYWVMRLHIPVTMILFIVLAIPFAAAVTSCLSSRAAFEVDMVRAVKEDW